LERSLIPIFTLSGTGNTLAFSDKMAEAFKVRGSDAAVIAITRAAAADSATGAPLIGFAAPVYCFGVSRLVTDFIRKLPGTTGGKAFICLNGGSGDDFLNRNAWRSVERALGKKGYQVPYVRILTMPSNWAWPFPDPLNKLLLDASLKKAVRSVDEILRGVQRRPEPSVIMRLFGPLTSFFGNGIGAKMFGRFLKADENCTRCGVCAKECPSGNITRYDHGIRFGWNCIWCMKCIYNCPAGAIRPRHAKFCVFKKPYSAARVLADTSAAELTPEESVTYRDILPYINDIER
jgi:ferredoxin